MLLLVIQPSGSIRDKEIIKFANSTNTVLIFSKLDILDTRFIIHFASKIKSFSDKPLIAWVVMFIFAYPQPNIISGW